MNLLQHRKKFGFDVFPSPRDISYNCIYADYARCPAERSNSDGSEQTTRRPLFLSVPLATQTSTANVSAVFSGSPLAVETLTQERRSNERTSLRRSNGAECFPLQTQPAPTRSIRHETERKSWVLQEVAYEIRTRFFLLLYDPAFYSAKSFNHLK